MRDYLSPARTYLGKAMEQVAALSRVPLKPRVVAMIASTAAVAFFAAGVIALRAMSDNSSALQGNVIETKTTVTPGSTSITQVGDVQSSVAADIPSEQPSDQSTSGNTSSTQTSITVNNQSVPVPQNGTVQKTITSDNGNTTQVEITSNSNGSTSNSSYSSSFIQMNTNTSSQNVSIKSP